MSVGVLTAQSDLRLEKQCNNNSVSNSTGKNVQEYINEQLKLNTKKCKVNLLIVPDGFENNKESIIRKY